MNAVNLIPADARRRGRSISTGLPFLGLVGGLAVVLVATALFVIAHDRVESRQSQLASINASAARWTAAAATYARDVSDAKARETQIGNVESLVGQRTDWSRLLGQLAAVMPPDSQLSTMNATAPSSAATLTPSSTTTPASSTSTATSASTGGSQIQLTACAATQSVVAQAMVNLRRITGVSGVSLSSSAKSGGGGGSAVGSGGSCGYPVTFSVTLAFEPAISSAAEVTGQSASDTSSINGNTGASQ